MSPWITPSSFGKANALGRVQADGRQRASYAIFEHKGENDLVRCPGQLEVTQDRPGHTGSM
jgi:hypothetical protein